MTTAMKIGELARAVLCPVGVIRYYEREGLLPPPARSSGNYRLYGSSHVERLRFIRNCRSLDMTHDEIRSLLACRDAPGMQCVEVNTLLEEHIGHVARRIRELEILERQLKQLRGQCKSVRPARECKIMKSLNREPGHGKKADGAHGRLTRTHG